LSFREESKIFGDIRIYQRKHKVIALLFFGATMYIYEYKEHGIKPNRADLPQFATDTVMVKKQMTFKQISDLLDVPVAQLQNH
jgi:activator of HSP90 ATPase